MKTKTDVKAGQLVVVAGNDIAINFAAIAQRGVGNGILNTSIVAVSQTAVAG